MVVLISENPQVLGSPHGLPLSVVPSHYTLEFTPDIEKSRFEGQVDIKIAFKETTDRIVFHSNKLDIYRGALKIDDQDIIYFKSDNITYDTQLNQATLVLLNPFNKLSEGEISFSFGGELSDDMTGIYCSEYEDGGIKKKLISTQFQSINARKAFPSWDEPSFKATFDIILRVPENVTAISNTNIIDEYLEDSKKIVTFETTPKMSTYLLAFAIGELNFIEQYTSNGIHLRVYAVKETYSKGQFALETASKFLSFYENNFKIPYPLKKLDMVAIPEFIFGAMENWGLLFYRPEYLLLDETSSFKEKQDITKVLAHEIAHQWFGNLVTMEWWADLWLNESFATWISFYIIDFFFPEWDYWTTFLSNEFDSALEADALSNSNPIETKIISDNEIDQSFNEITYNKGSSVIRMLYSYLGKDVFFSAINHYLTKHMYDNAKTNDLWIAFQEVTNQDVPNFIAPWTIKPGFPYLEVKEIERKKFYVKENDTWGIPLGLTSDDTYLKKEIVMIEKEMKISLPGSFYKLNKNNSGFFRVHYPIENLKRMGPYFSNPAYFSDRDLIGLFSDLSALIQGGVASSTDFFELLPYIYPETSPAVLIEIGLHLSKMYTNWFEKSALVLNGINNLQVSIFSPIVKKLGWEFSDNESEMIKSLRIAAILRAGEGGNEEVIKEAKVRFDSFLNGNVTAIHPNIMNNIFKIVAENYDVYELYKTQFLVTDSISIKSAYLAGLGAINFKSHEAANKLFDFILSDSFPSNQVFKILFSLVLNHSTRRLFWEYLRDHWTTVELKYAPFLRYLISYTIRLLNTESDYREALDFFTTKDTSTYNQLLYQGLELIQINIKWLERDHKLVQTWFETNNKF